MKTLIILMLLLSLGACKKSKDSGSSKNPTPPPNNPTPEPQEPPEINTITSVQKFYKRGENVEFVVTFSQSVTVSEKHTPFLSLTVGDQTRQANFDRGEENEREGVELFFSYEVEDGDNDNDGITLASNTINLDGGSIQNSSGGDLVNTILSEYQNFPNVKVDAILPIIESIDKANSIDSVIRENDMVDLVVTFNEPVKVTGETSLSLNVGGNSCQYRLPKCGIPNIAPLTLFAIP